MNGRHHLYSSLTLKWWKFLLTLSWFSVSCCSGSDKMSKENYFLYTVPHLFNLLVWLPRSKLMKWIEQNGRWAFYGKPYYLTSMIKTSKIQKLVGSNVLLSDNKYPLNIHDCLACSVTAFIWITERFSSKTICKSSIISR